MGADDGSVWHDRGVTDATADPDPQAAGRTYGGLTAEQRLAERRARLLDVGLELFATQGFEKTGVRDLCRAARIGERAFYEAVGGREALLRDVYLRATDDVIADIAVALVEGPADLRGRLHAGVTAFFRSITDDPRKGRLIYVESLGRGADIERTRREGLGRFVAFVSVGLADHLPDPAPSPAAVETAVSAAIIGIGEVAFRLAERQQTYTGAAAADHITTALVGAGLAFGLRP